MKIYIDNNYMCRAEGGEGLREFELPNFEGKCTAYIEGYRYVPKGESWTRSDGEVFAGEMISPAVGSRILEAYQAQYEIMKQEYDEQEQALNILIGSEVSE